MFRLYRVSGRSTGVMSNPLHRLPAGRIAWQVKVRDVDVRQVEHSGRSTGLKGRIFSVDITLKEKFEISMFQNSTFWELTSLGSTFQPDPRVSIRRKKNRTFHVLYSNSIEYIKQRCCCSERNKKIKKINFCSLHPLAAGLHLTKTPL